MFRLVWHSFTESQTGREEGYVSLELLSTTQRARGGVTEDEAYSPKSLTTFVPSKFSHWGIQFPEVHRKRQLAQGALRASGRLTWQRVQRENVGGFGPQCGSPSGSQRGAHELLRATTGCM
ncbi:uncharacterized protein PG998_008913 [Apiospora kogelbergensis]|uniref:uncharacterized protein n=1 Tax=Apiospora kogelbergensis TaxID=1337665 RepID=UPI0031321A3A